MQRQLFSAIKRDLDKKIVLLSGPRQVGKTTLSKALFPDGFDYFNADNLDHRAMLQQHAWRRDCDLVIFDELHKVKKWKAWIKGVYDVDGVRPRLLVTGSARLETFRKGGDSLAGRFFHYRLHPFSVAEVRKEIAPDKALETIMKVGGFPEPFTSGSETEAKRWRRSHVDRILRDDLRDLAMVRDVRSLETLVEMLRHSVGGPVSVDSISRDLQVSAPTVKSWIGHLESLHIIFVVTPYSRNIGRSLLKQPKVYFFDTGFVGGDVGARFENAVACALLKRLHFLEDTLGERNALHYVRDKEKHEVDFLTVRDGKPEWLVEAKVADTKASGIQYFSRKLGLESILLVKDLSREIQQEKVKVKKAAPWLAGLEA